MLCWTRSRVCGSTGGMYVCMLTEYADSSRARGMSGMDTNMTYSVKIEEDRVEIE